MKTEELMELVKGRWERKGYYFDYPNLCLRIKCHSEGVTIDETIVDDYGSTIRFGFQPRVSYGKTLDEALTKHAQHYQKKGN